MKICLGIIALAAVCWLAWGINLIMSCKKGGIKLGTKLAELWDEPFWQGPDRLMKVRDNVAFYGGAVVFVFYFLSELIGTTTIKNPVPYGFYYVITILRILLVYTLFIAKYSLKQRIVVYFCEICFLTDIFIVEKNIWQNKSSTFIMIMLLVLLAHEIGLSKIVKICFALSFAVFIVSSVLSLSGITENNDWTNLASRGKESGWLDVRYSLGFTHPNDVGIILAVIAAMWFIIRFSKLKWFDWAFVAVCAGVIMIIIDSRGALIFLFAFLALTAVFKLFPKIYGCSFLKYSATFFPAICAAVQILSAFMYNSSGKLWSFMDKILTGRISLLYQAVNTHHLTLFGCTTEGFDGEYINTLLNYGIVFLVVFVIVYCVLIKRLWKKQASSELAFVLAVILYSLVESFAIKSCVNISLFLLSNIILLEPADRQQLFHEPQKPGNAKTGKVASAVSG